MNKCDKCVHNGICTKQRYWSNGFESEKDKIENCDAFLPDFTCKPQTNYDKITSSVDALAEFLAPRIACADCPYWENRHCVASLPCEEALKEWLQKECEG